MLRKHWTRQELLQAFGLYCQLPFGKMHSRNPEIIRLATKLGRTPSALAMKLGNIASLDPNITNAGKVGLTGASALDKRMWEEMQNDWSGFFAEVAELSSSEVNESTNLGNDAPSGESYYTEDRLRQTKVRVGQHLFRQAILAAYNQCCCISRLAIPELLVASHIKPWHLDTGNRLNPRNGLCLSVWHDRAFDIGLMTITDDYVILISPRLQKMPGIDNQFLTTALLSYEGKKIVLPEKFIPNKDFLRYHNESIFLR